MKKLITGAIAAIAILLGFVACSGDLHENDVQPLYVVGAGFEGATWDLEKPEVKAAQATLVETDGSVQRFELKATASTAQVKFATARSWSNDIAGSDTQELFPIVNGAAVSLYSREANALPNTKNVVINDLTVGETYIIDITFDLISLATSIKVSGNAVVAPDMQIIVSTGESKPIISKIPMTRAGATYTYEFIAAKDLNLSYYFYCPSLNTTYYVDGNKLVQIDIPLKDAHGNLLNADGNVVTDDSYALVVWGKANKQPIVKDHKYSIKITADDIAYGFNGKISYEVEKDDINNKTDEGGILKNAVLIGQWMYTDNHDGDYAIDLTKDVEKKGEEIIWTGWSGKFTAKGTSVKFKVLRDKSEDTMAWGGSVKITAEDDYNKRGKTEQLTYKTTLVLDEKNGFAYTSPKEVKPALKEVEYITAEVEKNERYKISIVDNDDFGKFTICLTKLEPFGLLSDELAKCGIRGNMNGWDITEKDEAESTNNQFVFGPFTEVNPQFKLATPGDDGWKDFDHQYTYTEDPITIENKKDATATVTLRQSGDGDGNITVKGISEGAEYKIIIDVDDTKKEVKCTIKITKAAVEDKRSNLEKFADKAYVKGKISFNNKVPSAAKPTYATDKKSVTIKYGPFRKVDIGEWILTDGSMYYGSCKLRYVDLNGEKGTEVKLVADTSDGKNNEITDVTFTDDFYYIVIKATTDEDGNIDAVYAKIDPTKDSKLPYELVAKVYLAGSNPLTWNIGEPNAITANIVAEKSECKKYYYTFTAAGATLEFKVALDNSWDAAYSNCKDDNGEIKTILDAAPVEFGYANAKNAMIEGLTKGEKYTMVIDTSSDKPKVSIVSGADVLFAIGNADFGEWSWDTPVMMTPVAKGEWKYEFTATNAAAQFKFQTSCGGWHDDDTWNAKKEISVGDDYTAMENGAGDPNTTATLTVGTKYVLSVKSIDGKYNVKIATAE